MPPNHAGGRGEYATGPAAIPRRGWKQVLWRVKDEMSEDNLSLISAGVAFYAFLAVFPAVGALVMIYGLAANPQSVVEQLGLFSGVIPSSAYGLLLDQLKKLAAQEDATLSLGLLFSLALTLWSATKGFKALMIALNVVYEEREKRGFILVNIVAIAMTLGGILFVIVSLTAIGLIPVAVDFLGVGEPLSTVLLLVRWPLLLIALMVALAVLYRYGPSRRSARLKWITPGAVLAGILWLIASIGFSLYAANFGNYNETFGSMGAVVVLLFWFYISAYVVCIGGEINAELERQTFRDTTVGPPRPVGQRGAYVADNPAKPA